MNIIQDLKRLLSIPATPETFKRKVSEIVAKYDNDAETPVDEAPVDDAAEEEVEEVEESQAE